MNKCEKCGFLHYRTDPCRVKKEPTPLRESQRVPEASIATSAPRTNTDRNKSRHRPGYFTEYMRGYRARKRLEANAKV